MLLVRPFALLLALGTVYLREPASLLRSVHLQALRNSVLAGARQPNLDKWFERLWQTV